MITENSLIEIADETVEIAERIFSDCGAPDDFCWQSGLTFGGTNRVTLTPYGWQADESLCTQRFLAEFRKYYR